MIAKALLDLDRPDVVVATKGGLTRPNGRWDVDADPKWLRRCCEESVQNAGGAPIPLYYLHAVDHRVPFADSVGALVKLRDEGKIVHIGLSNVNQKQLDEALRLHQDRRRAESLQHFRAPRLRQRAHRPLPPRAHRLRAPTRRSAATRAIAGCRETPRSLRIARKHRTSPYVIALRWLLDQGDHIVPIPGASKAESTRSSLTAATSSWT